MRKFFVGLFMAAGFLSNSVCAVNWDVDPSFYVMAIHKDNAFLKESANEKNINGALVSPNVVLTGISALDKFDITTNVESTRYKDHDDLGQSEALLDATWSRGLERGDFQLSTSFQKKASINKDLEEVDRFDGALVSIYTKNLSMTWLHELSDTYTLSLSSSFDDVSYDEPHVNESIPAARLINFVNYEQFDITGTLIKTLDEKNKITFSLSGLLYSGQSNGIKFTRVLDNFFGTFFEFSDNKVEYTYLVSSFLYEYQSSETEVLVLRLGASNIDMGFYERFHLIDPNTGVQSTFFPADDFNKDLGGSGTTRGVVYELSYRKSTETGLFSVSFSQDREANYAGSLVENQRIRLDHSMLLTESWNLITYIQNRKTDLDIVNTFSLKGQKSMTKKLSLSMEYRYIDIQSNYALDDIVANSYYVGLSWAL